MSQYSPPAFSPLTQLSNHQYALNLKINITISDFSHIIQEPMNYTPKENMNNIFFYPRRAMYYQSHFNDHFQLSILTIDIPRNPKNSVY